jgi:hypothetical protein
MNFHRIQDPSSINEQAVAKLLATSTHTVVLQFSKESSYDQALLGEVNNLCQKFGKRVNVRFFAHYGSRFNCDHLQHIPDVRSLNLDCLAGIENISYLEPLLYLEEFAFGVFESEIPNLLTIPSLKAVSKLILAETRKNNIDLSPLETYENLNVLFLNAQRLNIETLSQTHSIYKLSLSSIERRQSLQFIRDMKNLSSLTLMLGGRENLTELGSSVIKHLAVLRVRGLSDLNLRLFPNLQELIVEDQPQLRHIDLGHAPNLRWLSVWNCKHLSELSGIENLGSLEYVFLGKTAIDPDRILGNASGSIQRLTVNGYGSRKDEGLLQRIASLGFNPAPYAGFLSRDDYE